MGWAFEFFVYFLSLRKNQQMFVMAVDYFAESMFDYEMALSAYPAWFGDMRAHPPHLQASAPAFPLLQKVLLSLCCGERLIREILGPCSVYFLQNYHKPMLSSSQKSHDAFWWPQQEAEASRTKKLAVCISGSCF